MKYRNILHLRIGRQFLNFFSTPLFVDSDVRATPSTTQAALASFYYGGLEVYGIASDRASRKTDEGFHKYTDSNGDSYEVYLAGANYDFANGANLHAAYGMADNVMTQLYFRARYPWKIGETSNRNFSYHQYFGKADGEGALPSVGPDYDSRISNLVVQYATGPLKLQAGYQKVTGDTYEISWDGFQNDDNGFQTSSYVQRLFFNRADEQSWQGRIDYDLSDFVDGLSMMARYTDGNNITRSDGREGSEWERDIELMYNPPAIKNLHFRWRNAYVKSSETFDSSENRFFINYNIKLF